ncbi:hypothetical protein H9L15_12040 [Sphingomonas daechungensis]|uniref:DUF2325 domain-containing protein n=1 Tax=Sphingomonas daechungensis TaxID=1176646 RepID=A0ABX6SZC7_9SPHN|nr:hypothetical protein [Sphingomonas daechungensis]QNP42805.1 hypothetical protein H9L15_12040 [Sphingomonas daechungensis]
MTEQELGQLRTDTDARSPEIADLLDSYNPSIIIFCRYSGPGYETIVDWARKNDLPIVYHVDDDLLAIPPNIGQRKFEHHNAPNGSPPSVTS